MPGIAPARADPTALDPAAAAWLHRFVREVVTADPMTHEPLSNIQIFLIESALECVDWEALARDPRLRRFDWEHAADPALKAAARFVADCRAGRSRGLRCNDAMGGER